MAVIAPAQPKPAKVRDLLREYVAGGQAVVPYYGGQPLQALSHAIDDLSADLGDDIYERMLRDPQVAACVAIWKASIIEDGVTIVPSISNPDDPDIEPSKAMADAARQMLEEMETPLDTVLWNMMDATAYGSKVAELIWEYEQTANGLALQVKRINPKPRRVTNFVVDPFYNVVGLLARRPDQPMHNIVGQIGIINDPSQIMPREKFAIFSFRPEDNDPRGTSLLRAAYDPWNRKRQVLPEFVKYLAQFASPSLIGIVGPDAGDVPVLDALGNIDPDAPAKTAAEVLTEVLMNFRNSSALAVSFGTDVKPLEVDGDGKQFLIALSHCDQQIVIAILTQTLATMESEHQARAAAQVHMEVLDTLIRQGKKAVVRMITWDILRRWVLYNWGPAFLHLTPKVVLGATEKRQQPAAWAALAQLWSSGVLQPDQLARMDDIVGLPPRDTTLTPIYYPPPAPPAAEPVVTEPPPEEGDEEPPEQEETRAAA